MSLLLAPSPCTTVADVASALAEARAEGSPFAADLDPLNKIFINPFRRVAWVQPGATWGELDAAAQEHGLAVTGARDPSAPVVTLGSGWLERKLGLAGDNLRAARVMSADGIVFTASGTQNPDLFWALRGGAAPPCVVVELELALRPVGPEVLAGMLTWRRDRAAEVMRAYRELMVDAPDALCGGLLLGEDAVGVVFLYAGDVERGAVHLAALRRLGPATDEVEPTSYCELQRLLPAGEPDGHLDALPDAAIDAIAAEGADVLLQPLGGAYARVGEMDTAAGHRDAAWAYQSLGDAPGRWARPRASVERDARLLAVKQRWDPYDVF